MFKRTAFIRDLEKNLGTGIHTTGRYVYFRNVPSGPLCRMTAKDYTEYKNNRKKASGEKFFWAHVEFVEGVKSI